MIDTESTLTALQRVWGDLPDLLGSGQVAFERRLLPLLRRLEAAPADEAALDTLLAMLEDDYPVVYGRMVEFMAVSPMPALPPLYRGTTSSARRATTGRYMIVPVWYTTDRANTGSAVPADRYSGDRGALQVGRLEVSIPDSHEKGRLEKPNLFRLQFRGDPERHVVLLSVQAMDDDAWRGDLKARLGDCSRRDVLLFIHGYNVSFDDAARRTAQFAYDLEFQGLPVLYSWPSEGRTFRYAVDEDNAHWTVNHFETVLHSLLTGLDAACVHAVAHSMGNRVLTEGLRRLDPAALPPGAASLREVVFAAPDVNADTFRTFVQKFHHRAQRLTLYVSAGDRAMGASQAVHKYPRAGDARDGLVLVAGLETIDASAVDQSFMGHSYFCDNRAILQDMFNLIMKGEGAAQPRFGLQERVGPGGRYWALQP